MRHVILSLILFGSLLLAQRRVDPRTTYHRAICIVPLIGSGTASDPNRPKYAPWPAASVESGIIGFYFEPTDDGKSAVVEFVAKDRSAFQALLEDKSIQIFEKGITSPATINNAVQQVRKDFTLDAFGMVMP